MKRKSPITDGLVRKNTNLHVTKSVPNDVTGAAENSVAPSQLIRGSSIAGPRTR